MYVCVYIIYFFLLFFFVQSLIFFYRGVFIKVSPRKKCRVYRELRGRRFFFFLNPSLPSLHSLPSFIYNNNKKKIYIYIYLIPSTLFLTNGSGGVLGGFFLFTDQASLNQYITVERGGEWKGRC